MLRRVHLAVVFFGFVSVQAETPVRLSLEEALATVDRVNVNVLLSREALAQATEAANVQRADLLPGVSATIQQRRSESPSVSRTLKAQGSAARCL